MKTVSQSVYKLSINSFEKMREVFSRSFNSSCLALHAACKGMSIVGGIHIPLHQRYMLYDMKGSVSENIHSIES